MENSLKLQIKNWYYKFYYNRFLKEHIISRIVDKFDWVRNGQDDAFSGSYTAKSDKFMILMTFSKSSNIISMLSTNDELSGLHQFYIYGKFKCKVFREVHKNRLFENDVDFMVTKRNRKLTKV